MTLVQKRLIILLVVVIIGIVLGRLAVRAVMNLMLGGTLFEGCLFSSVFSHFSFRLRARLLLRFSISHLH